MILNNIQDAYIGNNNVSSIYLGNQLIWSPDDGRIKVNLPKYKFSEFFSQSTINNIALINPNTSSATVTSPLTEIFIPNVFNLQNFANSQLFQYISTEEETYLYSDLIGAISASYLIKMPFNYFKDSFLSYCLNQKYPQQTLLQQYLNETFLFIAENTNAIIPISLYNYSLQNNNSFVSFSISLNTNFNIKLKLDNIILTNFDFQHNATQLLQTFVENIQTHYIEDQRTESLSFSIQSFISSTNSVASLPQDRYLIDMFSTMYITLNTTIFPTNTNITINIDINKLNIPSELRPYLKNQIKISINNYYYHSEQNTFTKESNNSSAYIQPLSPENNYSFSIYNSSSTQDSSCMIYIYFYFQDNALQSQVKDMLQSITFESNFFTFGESDFSHYFQSPQINTTKNSNKFYYTTKIQEPLKWDHYDVSQGKQVYVTNPFTNGIFTTTFKQSFPETIIDNNTVYNIKSLRIYSSTIKSEFHYNSSSVIQPTTQYYYCANINSTPLYEFSFTDFSNLTFPFSFISFGNAPLSIVLIFEELNSTQSITTISSTMYGQIEAIFDFYDYSYPNLPIFQSYGNYQSFTLQSLEDNYLRISSSELSEIPLNMNEENIIKISKNQFDENNNPNPPLLSFQIQQNSMLTKITQNKNCIGHVVFTSKLRELISQPTNNNKNFWNVFYNNESQINGYIDENSQYTFLPKANAIFLNENNNIPSYMKTIFGKLNHNNLHYEIIEEITNFFTDSKIYIENNNYIFYSNYSNRDSSYDSAIYKPIATNNFFMLTLSNFSNECQYIPSSFNMLIREKEYSNYYYDDKFYYKIDSNTFQNYFFQSNDGSIIRNEIENCNDSGPTFNQPYFFYVGRYNKSLSDSDYSKKASLFFYFQIKPLNENPDIDSLKNQILTNLKLYRIKVL